MDKAVALKAGPDEHRLDTHRTRKEVAVPDQFGFGHEVHRGMTYHRCIEEGCEEFPWGTRLSEAQRRRHHEKHERDRKRQIERAREQALAKARRLKREAERTNRLAYSRNVDAPSAEPLHEVDG